MKIEYGTVNKDFPKLYEIDEGTVFSPTNSQEIYISCDKTGMSNLFSETYSYLLDHIENPQSVEFEGHCTELIAVVHLESGTLCLMPCDTKVNPLNCKLVVEEE